MPGQLLGGNVPALSCPLLPLFGSVCAMQAVHSYQTLWGFWCQFQKQGAVMGGQAEHLTPQQHGEQHQEQPGQVLTGP